MNGTHPGHPCPAVIESPRPTRFHDPADDAAAELDPEPLK
jgi:hypothetical protein